MLKLKIADIVCDSCRTRRVKCDGKSRSCKKQIFAANALSGRHSVWKGFGGHETDISPPLFRGKGLTSSSGRFRNGDLE